MAVGDGVKRMLRAKRLQLLLRPHQRADLFDRRRFVHAVRAVSDVARPVRQSPLRHPGVERSNDGARDNRREQVKESSFRHGAEDNIRSVLVGYGGLLTDRRPQYDRQCYWLRRAATSKWNIIAEQKLGANFNAFRFHDFILAQGLLPPTLMRKQVEDVFVPEEAAVLLGIPLERRVYNESAWQYRTASERGARCALGIATTRSII